MRYILVILFIIFVFSGCKKENNPVEPSSQPILNVNRTIDSLQFSLTIPKAVYSVHGTLEATLTELNLSAIPETLCINTSNMYWTLKNDSGRVVMYGPHLESYHCIMEVIKKNESIVVGEFQQKIPSIPVGLYELNLDGYLGLSLRISIQ